MDWQTAAVVVIQALAVLYLWRHFAGKPRAKPKSSTPDVPTSALVRKKR